MIDLDNQTRIIFAVVDSVASRVCRRGVVDKYHSFSVSFVGISLAAHPLLK